MSRWVLFWLLVQVTFGKVAFAQQHPLTCNTKALSNVITEESLCAEQKCRQYLKTVQATLAKIQDDQGQPVSADIDFLQVAKILRSAFSSEYAYDKLIESHIKHYRDQANENQLIVESIQQRLKNPVDRNKEDQDELTVFSKRKADEKLLPEFKQRMKENNFYAAKLEEQVERSKNVDLSDRDQRVIRNLYILYQHRLEMLKARPTFRDCQLRDAELFSIFHYTGIGAYFINIYLHKKSGDPSLQEWADLISQSLSKLGNTQQLVERGGKLSEDQVRLFKKGYEFVFPAFMSASLSSPFSQAFRFTIRSKTGKYVAPLSMSPTEEEVLFTFNTRFKILDVQGNHYFLEEL